LDEIIGHAHAYGHMRPARGPLQADTSRLTITPSERLDPATPIP
jgi:hypothetical protein